MGAAVESILALTTVPSAARLRTCPAGVTLAAMATADGDTRAREGEPGIAEHAALSDGGMKREGNEDWYVEQPPLFAVADGMGGAQAGEVAPGFVAETLAAAAEQGALPAALAEAVQDANGRIHSM